LLWADDPLWPTRQPSQPSGASGRPRRPRQRRTSRRKIRAEPHHRWKDERRPEHRHHMPSLRPAIRSDDSRSPGRTTAPRRQSPTSINKLPSPQRTSSASAARSSALPSGQRHSAPRHQEYHRIRGIGSILQRTGRWSRMRRASRLRAGMKGENIASTSTFFLLFRRSGYCSRECGWMVTHFPSYIMCHSAVFPARAGFVVRLVHSV
jgi:hypothetical protein